MTLEKLPDDVQQLKMLVLENHRRANDEHQRANEYLDKYKSEEQRAELYKFRCEALTRKLYGPSSEKIQDQPGQQLLFELPAKPEPEPAAEDEPSKKRSGGG